MEKCETFTSFVVCQFNCAKPFFFIAVKFSKVSGRMMEPGRYWVIDQLSLGLSFTLKNRVSAFAGMSAEGMLNSKVPSLTGFAKVRYLHFPTPLSSLKKYSTATTKVVSVLFTASIFLLDVS